jgi:hypothetical protein
MFFDRFWQMKLNHDFLGRLQKSFIEEFLQRGIALLAAVIWLGGGACLTAAEGAPDDVDVQMLRHAAEQNDAEAQLRLARMYAQGKGVKQDWEEAYVWAMLARKKRQPDAAHLADEAASKLAVKQLLSGIRRVREFKPKPQLHL